MLNKEKLEVGKKLISEMRIGNNVLLLGKVVKVRPGDFLTPTFKAAARPITLTEDILGMAGITQYDTKMGSKEYADKEREIYIYKFKGKFFAHGAVCDVHLPYVHRLQNYYFENLDKELEIDFPTKIDSAMLFETMGFTISELEKFRKEMGYQTLAFNQEGTFEDLINWKMKKDS